MPSLPMDILIIIFSGAALLGVALSLIGFLQHVPRTERLAVISLIAVGAVALVTLAVYTTSSSQNEGVHAELCSQSNANREAIAALIAIEEQEPDGHNDNVLRRADELIDGPIC